MVGRQHPEPPAGSEPPDPRARPRSAVPDEVLREARAAFSQRSSGEIAALVFDSLVDEGAPPDDHRLRFDHPLLSVDVHVSVGAESTALSVALHPPVERQVELQIDGAPAPLSATVSGGRIRFDQVPHGLVRLWMSAVGDRPAIRTDWFRV